MSTPFQNKLLQYAPEPPSRVWNEIAAALDEGMTPTLSEKLYAFEEAPPAGSWEKISRQLEAAPTARVVPLSNRFKRPLQYAAAAAVLVLLALTTTWLLGKRSSSSGLSQTPQQQTRKLIADPVREEKGQVRTNTQANSSPSASLSHRWGGEEKRSLLGRLKSQKIMGSAVIGRNFIPKFAQRKQTVDAPSDKYMVYSDANGNAVRLPKKLFDLVCCATEDFGCKERKHQLQQKLATTSLSADFTGLLELLQNLRENQ